MMPLIAFYGQSIVDRFPTHAEQFNQNINSQAMNSANLARETLDVLEHYLAVALLCGVQAVELRAQLVEGSYDARSLLSPATATLYEAARKAAAGPPDADAADPLERSRRIPAAQGRGTARRHFEPGCDVRCDGADARGAAGFRLVEAFSRARNEAVSSG